MPLKQAVLPLINSETSINAVNTLKISPHCITAINTDGIGALNALEEVISVSQKKILILGAGGAATAIIDEAIRRHAYVYISNRTRKKSQTLAASYPINIIPLEKNTSIDFDVIINTIPESAFNTRQLTLWLQTLLRKKTVLMNINYNNKKDILSIIAKDTGYQYISGDAMYAYQAKAQLAYWGLLPSNCQE